MILLAPGEAKRAGVTSAASVRVGVEAKMMHLVSTPVNAARLRDATAQLERGEGRERDLNAA